MIHALSVDSKSWQLTTVPSLGVTSQGQAVSQGRLRAEHAPRPETTAQLQLSIACSIVEDGGLFANFLRADPVYTQAT